MRLIGLAGCIGSGKDTVAEYLCEKHGFRRIAMAEKLKEMTATLFSWDLDVVNGYTPEARALREVPDPYWSEKLGREWSPRIALQILGTDIFRQNLHDDFWVIATQKAIMESDRPVVISDVRFTNEARMIHDMGGLVIRVRRPTDPSWSKVDFASDLAVETYFLNRSDVHPSEWQSLKPSMNYDTYIDNDSTLEVLYESVESLLSSKG